MGLSNFSCIDSLHCCLSLPPPTPPQTQTRWYSFQFLIMELLMEIHDLYHAIRTVLAALPHGL
jgi:hypothetical protein